ncbi:MAG: AMP-binding protein [Gemmatimonadales bacterium]
MNTREGSLRLDERFDAQARRTPGSVALHDHGTSVTFAELQARSDVFAASLRASGVRDGGFVGLHMERSIGYVVSVLAILKLKGAVVPLPPSYPEARRREILSFAALDAVVDDAATPLDPSLGGTIVRFDAASPQTRAASAGVAGDADQPAFVLCSSGSTGQPKMIVRSHRSFFHRLFWTWETHPYDDGEVCCQKAHMTTTHAIYELFEPLLRGVPVHIMSDHDARALETFWETVRSRAVSRLLLVPSVLQASLDMPGFVAPPLKVVVLMGEYVHPELAGRAIAAFPEHASIYSIYGSTEASSTFVCDVRRSWRQGEELPLGVPISADVRDSVLSDDGVPVAAGAPGMLHVAGTPVFTEYFKSPAQTAAAFFTGASGEPLYRTRDRVCRLPDGALQFLGRADNTVKIRGFRVELEEVERTILLHAGVRQCAVIATEDEPGRASLMAFVSPATVNTSAVYILLRERLPAYMVPSAIIGADAFPLTPSGKIDRLRLARGRAQHAAPVSAGPQRPPTEQRITRVWQTVLNHDAFAPESSFFEVGGSSLTAFSAVYRLRDEFGLDRTQLTDQSLYLYPTSAALATYIDSVLAGHSPAIPSTQSPLVTLKHGSDSSRPPVFMISSAGGTLGAYEKLVKALKTGREVIGVRDPFLWDGRDPTLGFQRWIAEYVRAIRERQPRGPYDVVAYSSAGAVGYEIAQHLRRSGEQVAHLVLIDPLAIDRGSKRRFGYWSLESRFKRRVVARVVLLAGWLRLWVPARLRESGRTARDFNLIPAHADFLRFAEAARRSAAHIRSVSALLELNTGLPFALTDAEMAAAAPDGYMDALLSRIQRVAPEVDPRMIERIVVQYQLQVRSHHVYRLQRYDGKTVLFDPLGPYHGLLAAQFRPYVNDLRVYAVGLGEQSERTREISACFSARIRSHYQGMRDDTFVRMVAEQLEPLLT